MELDEKTFIEYAKEWWLDVNSENFNNNLLTRFKEWSQINLWEFWSNFERFIFNYNWLDIKIWWSYINWKLSLNVSTLFPKY